ncbi:hypothetical protein ATANTOWER_031709 [Ataeniobius toweri]|uniref:Uncharacterized protein n=1 Tax=Ataeniobius toweri TaxID=208326 RepID=A0ABU7B3J8_9TELE|nr:hypothetical protein [Ataeniobius toweri]
MTFPHHPFAECVKRMWSYTNALNTASKVRKCSVPLFLKYKLILIKYHWKSLPHLLLQIAALLAERKPLHISLVRTEEKFYYLDINKYSVNILHKYIYLKTTSTSR